MALEESQKAWEMLQQKHHYKYLALLGSYIEISWDQWNRLDCRNSILYSYLLCRIIFKMKAPRDYYYYFSLSTLGINTL